MFATKLQGASLFLLICRDLQGSVVYRKRGPERATHACVDVSVPDSGSRTGFRHMFNYPFMAKVTFIGAGSAVFARQLVTDILAVEGLEDGVFALVDIDANRLDLARRITERLVGLKRRRWKV